MAGAPRPAMARPAPCRACFGVSHLQLLVELERNRLSEEGRDELERLSELLLQLSRRATELATMRRMDAQFLACRLEDGARALEDLACLSEQE